VTVGPNDTLFDGVQDQPVLPVDDVTDGRSVTSETLTPLDDTRSQISARLLGLLIEAGLYTCVQIYRTFKIFNYLYYIALIERTIVQTLLTA